MSLLFLLIIHVVNSQPLPRIYYTPSRITFNESYTTQKFIAALEEPIICPDQNRPCQMILNYTSNDPRIIAPNMLIWDADADFNVWQETRNFTLTYEPFAGCYLDPKWDATPPWENRTGFNVLIDQVHPNVTSELYNGFNPYLEINLPPPVNCSGVSVAFLGTIEQTVEDTVSTVKLVMIVLISVFGGLCFIAGAVYIYRQGSQNSLITQSYEESGSLIPTSLQI